MRPSQIQAKPDQETVRVYPCPAKRRAAPVRSRPFDCPAHGKSVRETDRVGPNRAVRRAKTRRANAVDDSIHTLSSREDEPTQARTDRSDQDEPTPADPSLHTGTDRTWPILSEPALGTRPTPPYRRWPSHETDHTQPARPLAKDPPCLSEPTSTVRLVMPDLAWPRRGDDPCRVGPGQVGPRRRAAPTRALPAQGTSRAVPSQGTIRARPCHVTSE